ncbi:MAG TPA: RDD family protein [Thermobifida alba]|nr:RDD family protein [Thermobifida alba]
MRTGTDIDLLTRRALATGVDSALLALAPALAWAVVGRRLGTAEPPAGARWGVAVGMTLPAVAVLALAEARGATPGKRLLGVRVTGPGGRSPGYRRALVRLLAKTALPWELGHQAVWDFVGGSSRRGAVLAAAAHAALAAQAVAAACGSGRTYADLAAGTGVGRAGEEARRAGPRAERS